MKAEFEEKTFEVAANNELALLGTGYACPACGARDCVHCGANRVDRIRLAGAAALLAIGPVDFDDAHAIVMEVAGQAASQRAVVLLRRSAPCAHFRERRSSACL